jgi:hypothetical protein
MSNKIAQLKLFKKKMVNNEHLLHKKKQLIQSIVENYNNNNKLNINRYNNYLATVNQEVTNSEVTNSEVTNSEVTNSFLISKENVNRNKCNNDTKIDNKNIVKYMDCVILNKKKT